MRRVLALLNLIVLLIGTVGSTAFADGPVHDPSTTLPSPGHIQKAANLFVWQLSRGLYPEWAGANAVSPVLYHNPDGTPSVWVYSVVKGGRTLGYVTISATRSNKPFIEASPTPPPHSRLPKARAVAIERLAPNETLASPRFLYSGFLAYLVEFPVLEHGREVSRLYYHLKANRIMDTDVPPQPFRGTQSAAAQRAWDSIDAFDPQTEDVGILVTGYKKLSVPNYDQHLSSDPGTDCGPTAGAMIADYWDANGYSGIRGLEYYGTQRAFIDHRAVDMDTGFYGTTIPEWINGMSKHIVTEAGYSNFSFVQDKDTTTYDEFRNEISYNRPVGILIANFLPWGNTGNGYYEWHWVVGKGYDYNTNIGWYGIIVNNSWGEEDVIDWEMYNNVNGLDYVYVRP